MAQPDLLLLVDSRALGVLTAMRPAFLVRGIAHGTWQVELQDLEQSWELSEENVIE